MAKIQSVEPNIADLANSWLKSYKLDYKLEQESLNTEIDQALNDYYSKNGGVGGNRPDAKLLLQDKKLVNYPILIEYKGYKDKLVKLDSEGKVANKTAKNQPDFKNINSYAVNGAVHYANALLHYTSYTDIIAIGMTGFKDDSGNLEYEIGVYYVSKSNFGIGQKVDDYTDFSFLKKTNFDKFIDKVKKLRLTQDEIERLKEQREQEINTSLVKLNNDIYQNEKGLSERDRVYLVAASIIATLGVPGKVAALEKQELKSSTEEENRDGDIILRKIKAFLNEKNLPQEKRELIVRTLQNTLTTDNINKVENGESQLKRVFTKIVDDLGIYYKIGLTTDFTGKLFNEMYSWLGFSQDKLNDVVLTPAYIATLLARLARVNMDSYVWDFATGSAGLLVASMNEMLNDAKDKIKSPDKFAIKSAEIKANQLLGLEILSEIKSELNLPVLTDIHESVQAEAVAKVVDVLQIPAFLCRQTDLLVAAARTGLPVNVKKGQFMAPEDMKGAVGKLEGAGCENIMLTERGSSFGYHNLVVDMRSLQTMRSFGYPVIFDATHSVQLPGGLGNASGGQREFIAALSRAAAAVGINGIFMEVHPQPEKALSDGPNSLDFANAEKVLDQVLAIYELTRKMQ